MYIYSIFLVYSLLSHLMLPVNSRRKPLFYRYTVHINHHKSLCVPRIWVTHINSSTTYGGRILLGGDKLVISLLFLVAPSACKRAFLVTEFPWARMFFVHFSPCTSAFGVSWGGVITSWMLRWVSYVTDVSCWKCATLQLTHSRDVSIAMIEKPGETQTWWLL